MNRSLILLTLAALPLTAAAQRKPDALHTQVDQSLDRLRLGSSNAAWHLSAKVELLDRGQPIETGTMQVLRAANGLLRTTYDFPSFHQVSVHTASRHLREGDGGEAPPGLDHFLDFLLKPTDRTALAVFPLTTFHVKGKTVRFDCIHPHTEEYSIRHQAFCTIGSSPSLRFVHLRPEGYALLFEKIGTFQGGDVPLTADILFDNIPFARLELTYAALNAADQASLHKPPSAASLHQPTRGYLPLFGSTSIEPGLHPHVEPVVKTGDYMPSMLLRLEVAPTGNVVNTQILACNDPIAAQSFARRLVGRQVQSPFPGANPSFRNFANVNDQPFGGWDDFPAIGNIY